MSLTQVDCRQMQDRPSMLLENPAHRIALAPSGGNRQDSPVRSQPREGHVLQPVDNVPAGDIAVRFARILDEVVENQQTRTAAGHGPTTAYGAVLTACRGGEAIDS